MNNEQKAIIYGLASVACWSTVATAFKLSLEHLDIYQLLFYATLTASGSLLCFVLIREGSANFISHLTLNLRQQWRLTVIAGCLNPVLYYVILFKAYDLLPAQVAQPINYTWSIVLTLMAAVILKQPIGKGDFVAAAICYAGVFLIATQGDLSAFAAASAAGVALALASTFIWAGYWILNIRDDREPVIGLTLNFLIALPITLIVCLTLSTLRVPFVGLAGGVYVGLMEMAIAFLFWSTALRLTANAARVSNLIFLSPFVSLIIIHKVLGEEIHFTTIIGLMLIVGGLVWQQYAHVKVVDASG